MNTILEQIYSNNLHKNELFTKQVQFLINNLAQPVVKENKNAYQLGKNAYQLGQEGQSTVLSLLQKIFKDVIDQSLTAHVGDILVNHAGHTIMFEIKNKSVITKEDILKFQEDLQNFDVGVFISLRTDYIPQVGSFEINENQIYLSKDFINLQTFTLLKSFIEHYFFNKPSQGEQSQANQAQANQAQSNQSQSNQEQTILNTQIQKDLQIITVFKQNLMHLQSLFQQAQVKQNELNQIHEQIQSKIRIYTLNLQDYKNQNSLLYDFQKKELQEYLSKTPKNHLRKAHLVQTYDKLQLQQYTLDQIIEHFSCKPTKTGSLEQSKIASEPQASAL